MSRAWIAAIALLAVTGCDWRKTDRLTCVRMDTQQQVLHISAYSISVKDDVVTWATFNGGEASVPYPGSDEIACVFSDAESGL